MTTENVPLESRLRSALHAAEREAPLPPDFAASVVDTLPERSMARQRRWLLLLSTALAAGALVVALGAIVLPRLDGPAPGAEAETVESLFSNTDECRNELGGHMVTITYPRRWSTNEASSELPACFWFAPEPMTVPQSPATRPSSVAVTIGSAGGPFGSWGRPALTADVTIAGHEGIRIEEEGSDAGYGDGLPALVYQVALDETPTDGPILVAFTTQRDSGDYALNKAVLDQMMELLVID